MYLESLSFSCFLILTFFRSKKQVLSNWSKRIEDLKRERDQLKKQIKMKSIGLKLRSAEASPKVTLYFILEPEQIVFILFY